MCGGAGGAFLLGRYIILKFHPKRHLPQRWEGHLGAFIGPVTVFLACCTSAGMPTLEHGEQSGYLLASEPQEPHTRSQAATGVEPG